MIILSTKKVFCHLIRDLVLNLDKITCIIPADAESPNSLPFHFKKLIHHLVHQVNGSTPSLCLITDLVLYPWCSDICSWSRFFFFFLIFWWGKKWEERGDLGMIIVAPYSLLCETSVKFATIFHVLISVVGACGYACFFPRPLPDNS